MMAGFSAAATAIIALGAALGPLARRQGATVDFIRAALEIAGHGAGRDTQQPEHEEADGIRGAAPGGRGAGGPGGGAAGRGAGAAAPGGGGAGGAGGGGETGAARPAAGK